MLFAKTSKVLDTGVLMDDAKEGKKVILVTSLKIAHGALGVKTGFVSQRNVILCINVGQEDGVIMVYVKIMTTSAWTILIVDLTTTAIPKQSDVNSFSVKDMKSVAMAHAVSMAGVYHVKNAPVNLAIVLQVGTVFKAIAVAVAVNMTAIVLVDTIAIPQQRNVSLAIKKDYLGNV